MKKKYLPVVMVFVFLQFTGFVHSAIPASERAALIALYNSTNGDSWTNNSGWKSSPLYADGFAMPGTEGNWYGVSIFVDHVSKLALDDNNLNGSIPPQVGNLSNLKELTMYCSYGTQLNQLSGTIPAELGNLSNLEYLNLVGNQLSGNIPSELGNLSNLKDLDLRNNQLKGSIPPQLGNLSNLQKLQFWNNRLSGSIPAELGNLSNLTWFEITDNKLSGSIPAELGNLSNLTVLSIYGNQLSGSIPSELGNLSNLTVLCLRNNQLSGSIPLELCNLSNLKELYLSYNQLTGTIPPQLGNLSNLELLWLGGGNLLTGSIPAELGNLTNLRSLNLSGNLISGDIPNALSNLSKLEFLNLSANPLITGSIPSWLGSLTNLTYLALSNYSGGIPEELGNLYKLEFLNLNGSELTGTIPTSLGNLINLKFLGLICNGLTDPIPEELGNLSLLETLRLDRNQFSCPIPAWIGNLSNLEDLTLSGNNFSGSIPTWIGNLKQLTYLYLHRNQLSGSIPSKLGNLNQLEILTLSGNQLIGSIPSQVGNLSKLEILWLYGNQLSGEIPTDFTKLKKIIDLDIGYNCLTATDTNLRVWLNTHDPDWEDHQDQCRDGITLPTVITDAVSSITKTSALCGGNVTSDGGALVIVKGICWSTSANPTLSNSKTYIGAGTGIFTSSITGLSENTTYYVRAYATNSKGTSYGENISFTTLGTLPELDPPIGSFDTPVDGSTVAGSISVTGWALDDGGLESVKIYLVQGKVKTPIGDALFVEGARPDVAGAFPEYPNNTKAGWGYMMLTNFLPGGGNGTYVISATATDLVGKITTLGTKTIIVDNAHAVKPFGAIDTPTQGGNASGSSFTNWGWVLTPQPNSIPIDGSTLSVWVDGVNKGQPEYNIYREDISTLFPGYVNSNGAIGYFNLDTTKYDDGVHTISWIAEDNGGNSDGIGSRYFSIQNSSSDVAGRVSTSATQMNIQEIAAIPGDFSEPIKYNKGFNADNEYQELLPDENGNSRLIIKELERVEIQLSESYTNIRGFLISGTELIKLPIGSTLDARCGTFSWSPGPGFLGSYSLVFVLTDSNSQSFKKSIEITIEPKFNGK